MIHKLATFSGKVIDFYDDPDFLSRDSVKKLMIDGHIFPEENLKYLNDDDFAVKFASNGGNIKRAFPIYNPITIALSKQYLEKSADLMSNEAVNEAVANIKEAAIKYNLDGADDLDSLVNKVDAPEPHDLLEYAVNTYLDKFATYTPEDRACEATKIYSMAEMANFPITNHHLLSYVKRASFGDTKMEGLDQRDKHVRLSGNTTLQGIWAPIKTALLEEKNPEKFIQILTCFDKVASDDYDSKKDLLDPIRTAYGVTQKSNKQLVPKAKDIKDVVLGDEEDSLIVSKLYELSQLLNEARKTEDIGGEYVDRIIADPVDFYQQAPKKVQQWLLDLWGNLAKKHSMDTKNEN